jgi:hypothetical protein
MSQGDLSAFFDGQAFDPNSVEPASDFDVLPAGKYPVIIEAVETKATKAGNGHYLELRLCILDGIGKGRKLWERLNVDNPSEKAVQMARRSLSALVKATIGDVLFSNENQLLQQTCIAVVKVRDGENSIRTYERFGDAASVQPPAPGPVVHQAPSQHPGPAPQQYQPQPGYVHPPQAPPVPAPQQYQQSVPQQSIPPTHVLPSNAPQQQAPLAQAPVQQQQQAPPQQAMTPPQQPATAGQPSDPPWVAGQ